MIPAPTSFRETLRVFATYTQHHGLDGLFASVDWSTASLRQISHAFLGRAPATVIPGLFDPAVEARRLFESPDFRRNLLRRVIETFPDKQRILFVHLPKCAGSDFEAAMRPVYASLYESLGLPRALSFEDLADTLRHFARRIESSDGIFVGGHVPLLWYIDNQIYRYTDRLVTIIRHPHDIAVSFANYVVMCMRGDPLFARGDVKYWARIAGLERFDPEWSTDTLRALARRLVTTPGILPVNAMCALLGNGTASAAVHNLARVDIEITDISRYSDWLRTRWGIERKQRANAAPALVTLADLAPAERARIESACMEDMRLYRQIMAKLEGGHGLSVMGPDIF